MFSRVFVPPDCFAESPPPSSITGTSCPSFSLLACPFLKSSLWHFRHKLTASPEPQEPPVLISTSAPNSASGIAGGISSGPEEPGRMNCLMVRVPRWSSGFLISFFSSPLPSLPSLFFFFFFQHTPIIPDNRRRRMKRSKMLRREAVRTRGRGQSRERSEQQRFLNNRGQKYVLRRCPSSSWLGHGLGAVCKFEHLLFSLCCSPSIHPFTRLLSKYLHEDPTDRTRNKHYFSASWPVCIRSFV